MVADVKRSGLGTWVAGAAGVVVAAVGGARVAAADGLEFAIGEGRVTAVATGIALGDVLAEWSRAGGTRFVGAGELGAVPVSLRLVDVSEAEALRLLLRPAAGYLAASRTPGVRGASMFDRVKIRAARRALEAAPEGASPRRRTPPSGPVRDSPVLSEQDQRARLQRLLSPRRVAVPSGPPAAPRAGAPDAFPPPPPAGALYAPTTPRPGMVVVPSSADPP